MKKYFVTKKDNEEIFRQWVANQDIALPSMTFEEAKNKVANATKEQKNNLKKFRRNALVILEKAKFHDMLIEMGISIGYEAITLAKITRFMRQYKKVSPSFGVGTKNMIPGSDCYTHEEIEHHYLWLKNMKLCFLILELNEASFTDWITKQDFFIEEKIPQQVQTKTKPRLKLSYKIAAAITSMVIITLSIILPFIPWGDGGGDDGDPFEKGLKQYSTEIINNPILDLEKFYNSGFILFERTQILDYIMTPEYWFHTAEDKEDLLLGYIIETFFIEAKDGNVYYIEEFRIRTYKNFNFTGIDSYDLAITQLNNESINTNIFYIINGNVALLKFTYGEANHKYDYFISLQLASGIMNLETLMEDLFIK